MKMNGKRGALSARASLGRNLLGGSMVAGLVAFACTGSEADEAADEGVSVVTQRVTAGGFVVIAGDDADDAGHCQGTACGGLYPRLFVAALAESDSPGAGILAVGVNAGTPLNAFNSWNAPANGGPGAAVTFATTPAQIAAATFGAYDLVYVPSTSNQTSGGMNGTQLAALNARQADIAQYVNVAGGSLLALTEAGAPGAWGWLPLPLTTATDDFNLATPTAALTAISPTTTAANLSHCCFHNVFTGPVGFSGLGVLATKTGGGTNPGNPAYVGLPVLLGGKNVILTAEVCDDEIDNDGDGDTDHDDADCRICGNAIVDQAGEECDDGNLQDGDGCSAVCTLENLPPEADAGDDVATEEGSATALSGSGSDPDGDVLTYGWTYVAVSGVDLGATCAFSQPLSAVTDVTCTDDGLYEATLTVTDPSGETDTDAVLVEVSNAAPALSLTAPTSGALYPVGSTVTLVATFTDAGANDTHECTVDWDGAGGGSYPAVAGACDTSTVLSAAGVYTVTLTVADDDGATDTETVMIVVYDPSAGFVTGGGFINSPGGAYVVDPTLAGKANFGFVSKYQKGASIPSGQTEFQFHAGDLSLHSETYQWLVVAGARAQLKGAAAVNGVSGYQFLLTIVDGQVSGGGGVDRFRMKVTGPDGVVYDNAPGSDDINSSGAQALGGGSIVIHKK